MRTNHVFALLHEMATFVKVVETGSFTAAARQFGSTPSAVSRSISKLEQALNTRLLQRSTRKLRLSEAGQDVFQHAQAMLHSMHAAVSSAQQREEVPCGTLKIAAPRALGRFWIHPLIPEFLAEHPHIDVVFKLEDRLIDLIDEDVDLAFRITDEPPPGMMGRKLIRFEQLICATPAYIQRYGRPCHPHDLKLHSCIRLSEDAVDARWRFSLGAKSVNVDVRGRYAANHTGVRLEAILSDLGIGSLPSFLAQRPLAEGKVEQILPDWAFKTNYFGDVWMLYPPSKHVPARVSAFIHFVAQRLKRET